MYVIGDKYDIPALQLLAKKRFTQTTACHWTTYDDFPAVLDEFFTTTRSTDPLRRLVCTLMERDYATNPAMRIKIWPIVEKHGDLALKMLDCMMARMDARLASFCEVEDKKALFHASF